MDLVVALVVGGIVGWLASLVMGTDPRAGVLAHVLVGLIGSVLGLWLAGLVGGLVASSPARWVASLAGATVLIAVARALGRARSRAI